MSPSECRVRIIVPTSCYNTANLPHITIYRLHLLNIDTKAIYL